MNIKFSRHAKRRAKLYKIKAGTIEGILNDMSFLDGKYELIRNVTGFGYPIKIVVVVENGVITVVTNYPLKKGRKNENSL
ncbi:MAG: hypothetical protein LGR52_07755 [Candidatus Thiosymbion ectosymbiont of Robbea hypermnestra]|nr:hypothetical protein [Candidatus Thiosymbion ectosymbiont of Robbea hypermnestra]